MKTVTPTDLAAEGVVSLWLGNLEWEAELEEYLGSSYFSQFDQDFGFCTHVYVRPGMGEIYLDNDSDYGSYAKVTNVRELLESFSSSRQWIEPAIEAAKAKGWTTATTGYALYSMKYDPALANPNATSLMTFIGTFSYDHKEHENDVREGL